ncbi:MAG: MotA/TolQ/ExbB proton channel family protein, partial [Phycisphaerales bacterium]
RESVILPSASVESLRGRVRRADWAGLKRDAERDPSFVGRVVHAALQPVATGRTGARENAELAASEEASRWFRRIEMLNVIGHLGPLLGLVGTVYGMIIAFAALGETGGRAGPGELSLGISKALFHTFLGLMLAIPSLLAYGYFRTIVDKVCTRAMQVSGQIVEAIPDEALDTGGADSAR